MSLVCFSGAFVVSFWCLDDLACRCGRLLTGFVDEIIGIEIQLPLYVSDAVVVEMSLGRAFFAALHQPQGEEGISARVIRRHRHQRLQTVNVAEVTAWEDNRAGGIGEGEGGRDGEGEGGREGEGEGEGEIKSEQR